MGGVALLHGRPHAVREGRLELRRRSSRPGDSLRGPLIHFSGCRRAADRRDRCGDRRGELPGSAAESFLRNLPSPLVREGPGGSRRPPRSCRDRLASLLRSRDVRTDVGDRLPGNVGPEGKDDLRDRIDSTPPLPGSRPFLGTPRPPAPRTTLARDARFVVRRVERSGARALLRALRARDDTRGMGFPHATRVATRGSVGGSARLGLFSSLPCGQYRSRRDPARVCARAGVVRVFRHGRDRIPIGRNEAVRGVAPGRLDEAGGHAFRAAARRNSLPPATTSSRRDVEERGMGPRGAAHSAREPDAPLRPADPAAGLRSDVPGAAPVVGARIARRDRARPDLRNRSASGLGSRRSIRSGRSTPAFNASRRRSSPLSRSFLGRGSLWAGSPHLPERSQGSQSAPAGACRSGWPSRRSVDSHRQDNTRSERHVDLRERLRKRLHAPS